MRSHAQAANLLADAENVLGGRATKTTKLMADQGRELDSTARRTENLGKAAEGAAVNFGPLGSGMGVAIAAGVALSPVLVTVGFGLAGLAAAAYGVIKPIEAAAQKTGGLKANLATLDPEQRAAAQSILALQASYDQFQKALKPVVLGDFNAAIVAVRPLLKGIEPVAASTGKALEELFAQLGAEFRSSEWRQFFGFMATTAGPDIRLLGESFTNLLHTLPPLLESLQPIATDLLQIAAAATKVVSVAAITNNRFEQMKQRAESATFSFGGLNAGAKEVAGWLTSAGVGATHLSGVMGALKGSAGSAARALAAQGDKAGVAAAATAAEARAVTNLVTALAALSSGLLTTEQDQVAWKQAQQAATAAIKANSGSLDSNKAAALAARSAIISSTQSALTYANQELNVRHNTDAASQIIRDQIHWLQDHAGHSKIAAQEIDALRQALAKLTNKRVTVTLTTAGGGIVKVTSSVKNAAGFLEFHKAGYRVPGYGGGDTYGPIMVERGETIVPKHLTPAVAPLMKANRVPGFAAGGLIGELGTLVPFASGRERVFGVAQERTFGTTVVQALIRHAQMVENAAKIASINAYGGGPVGGGAAAAQAYARSRLGSFGWSPGEMAYLVPLWNRESGWNRFAENPSSHAYGIPQALPFTKMPKAAWPGYAGGQSSMGAQVNWGMSYIRGRYGNPASAWGHEMRYGWYDRGGWLPPGLSVALNTTGRPEPVGLAAGARGGGGMTINVNVAPAVASANPALGRDIAQHLTAFLRHGGQLYPHGMTPR